MVDHTNGGIFMPLATQSDIKEALTKKWRARAIYFSKELKKEVNDV